jgi:hypothetical protein
VTDLPDEPRLVEGGEDDGRGGFVYTRGAGRPPVVARPPPLPVPDPSSVRVGDTIRLRVDTCSSVHRAPNGSIAFPKGLVVLVDDVYLDAPSARRWVRNRIAEPYPGGVPGDIVTDAERNADTVDLDAQIARLEHLKARALARAQEIREREEEAERAQDAAGYVRVERRRNPEGPLGADLYRVPADEDPLAVYGLADFPKLALVNAGFTRPALIDAATDEELLEIKGVGLSTLTKLRGRAE